MDSSRECRHATCPTISPGCERCVTSRNRSPSSPPDPVKSSARGSGRGRPTDHGSPRMPGRADARRQPAIFPPPPPQNRPRPANFYPQYENTRITEVTPSIYFYDINSQVELRLFFHDPPSVHEARPGPP